MWLKVLGWWVSFMIHWVWAVHQCLCISWRAGKSPLKCVAFLYGAVFVPDDTAAQQDAFNGTENAGAHAKFLQVPEVVQGLLSLPHHIIGVHVDRLGSSVMVIWGSVNVNGSCSLLVCLKSSISYLVLLTPRAKFSWLSRNHCVRWLISIIHGYTHHTTSNLQLIANHVPIWEPKNVLKSSRAAAQLGLNSGWFNL